MRYQRGRPRPPLADASYTRLYPNTTLDAKVGGRTRVDDISWSPRSVPIARKAAADLDPGCDPSAVTDGEHPERRKKSLWWRVFLLAAMIVATLNVWTGSPLLALW